MCNMVTDFFFNDTATTEIYTLSLHDALPISPGTVSGSGVPPGRASWIAPSSWSIRAAMPARPSPRELIRALTTHSSSEEHTSELQSRPYLVWRLLLEKKKLFFLSDETVRKPQ